MDGRVYYDVTLSRIDAGYGHHGQHMFYRMSALHNHVQGLYVLWTRWGSVGEDGQYQRTPYRTRAECITEFLKVFKSKTGFPWAERATGVPKDGRYKVQPPGGKTLSELQMERLQQLTPAMLASSTVLPPPTQFFLRLVTDSHNLRANMVQDRPFQLPFGAAHQTAIKEAVRVLNEARALLQQIERLNDKAAKVSMAVPTPAAAAGGDGDDEDGDEEREDGDDDGGDDDEGTGAAAAAAAVAAAAVVAGGPSAAQQMEQITQERQVTQLAIKKLSEKFYELVPVKRDHVGSFQTVAVVDEALDDLSKLEQQNIAAKMIIAAHAGAAHVNPFEYILRAVGTSITPLAQDSSVYETLRQHATPHHSTMEVASIFEISRRGEATRFLPYATKPNRMLLFHGTRAANVLGILTDGLCCAPPSAQVTGHCYGKGVYFADSIDKSIGYASNQGGNPNTNNHSIVFLAEVFLGKIDPEGAGLRDGYDSVLAPNGPTHFTSIIETKTGARIPIGAKNMSECGYNEYVIFNPAQIRLRYLVVLRRNNFEPLSDAAINALPMYRTAAAHA